MSKIGQARVTIPKALFEALGWKHSDNVEWEIIGKNKLKLELKQPPTAKGGRDIV